MEKIAVNNLVVTIRQKLKVERFLLIRKMYGQIKKMAEFKGLDAEKRKQKAARWEDQVKYLKRVDLTTVARQALAGEEPWQNVLVRKDSTPEQRAVARLIGRPTVQQIVNQFRKENEDWKEWLPKVYEAWEKRKAKQSVLPRKQEKQEGEPRTGPLATSTPQVKRKAVGKAGKKTAPPATPLGDGESAAKEETTSGAAEAPSTGAPRPLAKKKVLVKKTGKANVTAKGIKETAKKSQLPGKKPKGVPTQSSGDAEEATTSASPTKGAEEPPPRKFAAGDPFFWQGDKADPGPAGSPPPRKQRPPSFRERPFPYQSRSFGGPPSGPNRKERRRSEFRPGAGPGNNSWKQGRRSDFGPRAVNARQSPAAMQATPPSAKKDPKETELHPSWVAKRQTPKALVPFQGKKTTFS